MLSSVFCINKSNEESFASLFNHPFCPLDRNRVLPFLLCQFRFLKWPLLIDPKQ